MQQTYVFGNEIRGFADLLMKYRSKTDTVVPTSQIRMAEDGRIEVREQIALDREPVSIHAEPTDWAFGQMGEYAGIHASYINKMRQAKANNLIATNFNYWFSQARDRRLLRVFEGSLIGFLSDRYQAIDNFDIVKMAMSTAEEITKATGQEIQTLRPYLTPTTMSVTLLTTDYVNLDPSTDKDIYRMGVHIRNSEVGKGAFSMRPLLMRTSCMNSNIFAGYDDDTFRRVHRGKKLGLGNIWSQETHLLESATIRSQVRDVTKAAFSKEIANERIQRMKALKDEKFQPTPARTQATRRILGFSEDETDGVFERIEANNRYEFVQAVTNYAQTYYKSSSDPERGTELEVLGGQLASSSDLWEAIEDETKRQEKKQSKKE